MLFGLLLLVSHCLSFGSVRSVPFDEDKAPAVPLLLLISFDGFRWDYPDIYHLPHFDLLAKRGVRLQNIENSFATVTFPSHFTMITGLFEETHGIVANTIYDPSFNESISVFVVNDTKWWSQNPYTQPIWVSNQLAPNSSARRSGVIAWPGCEVPINGHSPRKFQAYARDRAFDSILKQMFDWFYEPESTRINLGVMYYPEPDETGHFHGPNSSEMAQTLALIDSYVGQLLKLIDQDKYLQKYLNVIITSDHGMHEIDGKHQLVLEKIIDKSLFDAYGHRVFANIFVRRASDIDRIYANLSTLTNYEVYKKADVPDEYHYQFNVRIGDILIVSRIGYEILLPGDDGSERRYGDHGYDNRAESMHPIFYAFGPAFRHIDRAKAFRNVDLYPLMSYLLDIPIRPTNGSLENVKHILIDFPPDDLPGWFSRLLHWFKSFLSSSLIVIICILVSVLMGCVYSFAACRHLADPVFVEKHEIAIRYHLLDDKNGSINNLIASESEDEVAG